MRYYLITVAMPDEYTDENHTAETEAEAILSGDLTIDDFVTLQKEDDRIKIEITITEAKGK